MTASRGLRRRQVVREDGFLRCMDCDEWKPPDEFHRNGNSKSGRATRCKVCSLARHRAYYLENRERRIVYAQGQVDPEQKREYDREYRLRPEVRARKLEQGRRYRTERREKYRAHYTVQNALRDGRLTRQPCEVCGKPNAEAHHDDYSKPLEVRWLCKAHHRTAHAVFTA